MVPLISIIHPSRSRPEMAKATIENWLGKAYDPRSIEYILCIDDNDPSMMEYTKQIKLPIVINVGDSRNAIQAINRGAKRSDGNLIVVVSDDFDCPIHWDKLLLDALEGKEYYVVKTQDGQQDWIITFPIMDRKYYERFGYVYHPGYQHMFSDTEMTHVSEIIGKKISLDIVFPHKHYTTGAMQKDAINVKNDATWNQGEKLYLQRLNQWFGIPENERVNPRNQCAASHTQWLQSKGIYL